MEKLKTALETLRASDDFERKFVFDVLNFHHYSFKDINGGDNGIQDGWWISPEEDNLRCRLMNVRQYVEDELELFGMEYWLSEFGYDDAQFNNFQDCNQPGVTINGQQVMCNNGPDIPALGIQYPDNVTEYQHATAQNARQTAANWLIRAYLEISAAGFDRAVAYDLIDRPDAAMIGSWDNHCGLVGLNEENQPVRKISWWYVASLNNLLEGRRFAEQPTVIHYDNVEEETPTPTSTTATGFEGYVTGEIPTHNLPRHYIYADELDLTEDCTNTEVYTHVLWSPTSSNHSYLYPCV